MIGLIDWTTFVAIALTGRVKADDTAYNDFVSVDNGSKGSRTATSAYYGGTEGIFTVVKSFDNALHALQTVTSALEEGLDLSDSSSAKLIYYIRTPIDLRACASVLSDKKASFDTINWSSRVLFQLVQLQGDLSHFGLALTVKKAPSFVRDVYNLIEILRRDLLPVVQAYNAR